LKDDRHGSAVCSPRTTERNTQPQLSEDAAIVLALVETAVSFAASAEDEAERWGAGAPPPR
jgi:hypothetical protein